MDPTFLKTQILMNIILMAAMLLGALATVMLRQLVKAAIALAFTSVVLCIVMFKLDAPWAAVFELSVCAGLITVVFISAISLVKPATEEERAAHIRFKTRRYFWLPLILLLVGCGLTYIQGKPLPLSLPEAAGTEMRQLLWGPRALDLLGQILVLLSGVWGVVILFKEEK
ncbi:MAG: NADH-quinone oxidoreductase subunit J [Kiritimatiellaeota bacterium]|nr:NADH-quinone oxidoreductase subunit J [Kiritimatiellota bacterium]